MSIGGVSPSMSAEIVVPTVSTTTPSTVTIRAWERASLKPAVRSVTSGHQAGRARTLIRPSASASVMRKNAPKKASKPAACRRSEMSP